MLMEEAGSLSGLVTHAFTTPPSILIQNCAFLPHVRSSQPAVTASAALLRHGQSYCVCPTQKPLKIRSSALSIVRLEKPIKPPEIQPSSRTIPDISLDIKSGFLRRRVEEGMEHIPKSQNLHVVDKEMKSEEEEEAPRFQSNVEPRRGRNILVESGYVLLDDNGKDKGAYGVKPCGNNKNNDNRGDIRGAQ
ncbi:hypothetical protein B0H13DRAFT_1855579 [Mycena leptocephala]|nr:hypothetical protein B0H13DRAFT_1855579 [Mycena leptocephala]